MLNNYQKAEAVVAALEEQAPQVLADLAALGERAACPANQADPLPGVRASEPKGVEVGIGPVRLGPREFGRVVTLSDGSGRLESFNPVSKTWEPGGFRPSALVTAPIPSPEELAAVGIPSDIEPSSNDPNGMKGERNA